MLTTLGQPAVQPTVPLVAEQTSAEEASAAEQQQLFCVATDAACAIAAIARARPARVRLQDLRQAATAIAAVRRALLARRTAASRRVAALLAEQQLREQQMQHERAAATALRARQQSAAALAAARLQSERDAAWRAREADFDGQRYAGPLTRVLAWMRANDERREAQARRAMPVAPAHLRAGEAWRPGTYIPPHLRAEEAERARSAIPAHPRAGPRPISRAALDMPDPWDEDFISEEEYDDPGRPSRLEACDERCA